MKHLVWHYPYTENINYSGKWTHIIQGIEVCFACLVPDKKNLRSLSSLFWFLADAVLKEKLKKIISSDFFTATPEMKAPVEVAAAVGQLHISEVSTVPSETAEGDIDTLDNKVISHMLPCKYILHFF